MKIRVCCVGLSKRSKLDEIKLKSAVGGEEDSFDFVGFDGGPLRDTIIRHRPHVFVVFGPNCTNPKWRQELLGSPLELRRWAIEVDESLPGHEIAERIMGCYLDFLNPDRFPTEPLVSVLTPTYNTGKRLYRPFNSLLDQKYQNWEWILFDDSTDLDTQDTIDKCLEHDMRVHSFKASTHCGSIGEMKRRCAGVARGEIFIELDHDDELTETAIADCVAAFNHFPDAGFAYSNSAGVHADGRLEDYGDNWGMGYGPPAVGEFYKGRQLKVIAPPPINSKTVRHIVSMPNHFRAWRRSAYYAAGGHSSRVHVCDDYELMVRTFLTTRFVHVNKLGYIQNLSGESAQYNRFGEIHRLVRYFRGYYDKKINQRFLELGVPDFCWNGEFGNLNCPNVKGDVHAEYRWGGPVMEAMTPLAKMRAVAKNVEAESLLADKPANSLKLHNNIKDWPPLPVKSQEQLIMPVETFNPAMADVYAPNIVIVDDWYKDPEAVRELALKQDFKEQEGLYKGVRTPQAFRFPGMKERFEQILQKKITSWDHWPNGCFQITTRSDKRVFHCDQQRWAAAVYLSPNPLLDSGTHLIRSKVSKKPVPFAESDILDQSAWEAVATASNVFNRLVIWNGRHAHCAGTYFGTSFESGRLVQLFFFDSE